MIGYKHWATVLAAADKDRALRTALMLGGAAFDLAIGNLVHVAVEPDDHDFWARRYRLATLDPSPVNVPAARLFWGLGLNIDGLMPEALKLRILGCPRDCIRTQKLIEIGILIADGDTVPAIQQRLTDWARDKIPADPADHQREQFRLIHDHVGPGPLPYPVDAFMACPPQAVPSP